MDRKSILAIVICLALLFVLQRVANKVYPPIAVKAPPTNSAALEQPAPVGGRTNPQAVPTAPTLGPDTTPQFVFASNALEQTIVVSNENARYTFTSLGGGLESVELIHYPEKVTRQSKHQPLTNGLASLNTHAPVPVLAVLGHDSVQGDGIFALAQNGNTVRAEKTLPNGLRLIKEFRPTTNYLMDATVRVENTSDQPLALPAQEWVIGTATPMAADDSGQNDGVLWYNGIKKEEIAGTWFDNRTLGCFPGVPRSEYRSGTSNVVWASVHNQYFTLIAMPAVPAESLVSRPIELPRPPAEEIPANMRNGKPPKGYQTAFVYPAVVLAPGQVIERQFHFYAGPKEYRTLANIAESFKNNVDLVMGFGGFFGFFSKALLLGMNWLHTAFMLPYGWAIIAITVIIKILFWPLTTASTRSMKRMAALQPQMKALQEKYKDDPAKMNKKVMEFWKEHKVNPMGGCLPMLLQTPVFIGFFYMIRSAIELRGASFLWVADLSKPDTLFVIPGLNFPFNLLPLLMGVTMLWQSHMTPPSPGMEPMQQKMMRYMPLMFLVFLYNYSAGLALYWTVQNLLSVLQTKLTKAKDPVAAPRYSIDAAAKKVEIDSR